MKILFLTRHFGCLRSFEGPITRLAGAGHQLHLVAHHDDVLGGQAMIERWAAEYPAITFERLPDREATPREDLAMRIRLIVDFMRYLSPEYRGAPGLTKRAIERTPRIGLRLAESRVLRSAPGRAAVRAALRAIERSLPRPAHVDRFIAEREADVALFTPLLALGSEEMDYLDAACARGVPSIFCVWSWDNLSSKALVRTVPDAVFVWNEIQKREATALHRVPRRKIVVTGAQSFDHWFEWRSTRTAAAFRREVGLPEEGPMLLWVCSALLHGSPPEAPFVRTWLEQLRASSDPELRHAPVLIRPHPSRLHEWDTTSVADLGPVAIRGRNPVDGGSRADYFDSLSHATAVVGLNTSAFLEAAIVGRPVYTILRPEQYDNQEGTLHFAYLTQAGGGLLHAARDWDDHHRQLGEALRAPAEASARSRRFVEAFIRPHGLDVTGTDRFLDAVNATATRGASPRRAPWYAPLGRRVAGKLLARMEEPAFRDWWLSPREFAKRNAIRRKRAAKDDARRRARAVQTDAANLPSGEAAQ